MIALLAIARAEPDPVEVSWDDGGIGRHTIDVWTAVDGEHREVVHIEDDLVGRDVWLVREIRVSGTRPDGGELWLLPVTKASHTEVWVDGMRLHTYTTPGADGSPVRALEDWVVRVPDSLVDDGRAVVAIRAFTGPNRWAWFTGALKQEGVRGPRLVIGDRESISTAIDGDFANRVAGQLPVLVATVVLATAGLIFGLLYAVGRRNRGHLWLASMGLATVGWTAVQWGYLGQWELGVQIAANLTGAAVALSFLQYLRELVDDPPISVMGASMATMAAIITLVLWGPTTRTLLWLYGLPLFGILFAGTCAVGALKVTWLALQPTNRWARIQALAVALGTISVIPYGFVVTNTWPFDPQVPAWLASIGWSSFAVLAGMGLARRTEKLHRDLAGRAEELQTWADATSRFVPRRFLEELERPAVVDVELGDAQARVMTILFSDIRGFTSTSEQMTPTEAFAFVNEYLGRMEPEVTGRGGFVDKYIGDAVMALFPDPDAAVHAALGMLDALDAWNAEHGRDPVAIGIGIHTGPLILGTVGGQQRMDATVIGDAVNLASRVEGMTKAYATSLLITGATVEAMTDAFVVRPVDRVAAKGKSASVDLYEVLREGDPARETVAAFTAAIEAFRSADFTGCIAALEGVDDPLADQYRRRCERWLESADGFTPVRRFTTK